MAQIVNVFEQYKDTNGKPLDGYIYLGTSNLDPETNPIAIYWDSSYLVPAAQPLRVMNGYVIRSGTPANVYTAGLSYSVTFRDLGGALVYTVSDFALVPSGYDASAVAITGGTINGTTIGSTSSGGATILIPSSTGRFTTITASGGITPNTVAGIVGTTLGDSAQAGSVGEVLDNTTTRTHLQGGFDHQITTRLVTAGCWRVSGSFIIAPNGGSTISRAGGGVSSTSFLPNTPLLMRSNVVSTTEEIGFAVPPQVFNFAVSTVMCTFVKFQTAPAALFGDITGTLTAVRIR